MAVYTGQPSLLMDIWNQFVIFNSIWPEVFFPGCKGGSVFAAKIMFVAAIIVCSDKVCVVASKTLNVAWKAYHFMANQFTVSESHVTGSATGTSLGIGIRVTGIKKMTTETTSPQ